MNLAQVLVNTPTLNWEGVDLIGQKAFIKGDRENGYDFRYFDEETNIWTPPADLDEYRWITEAFLADLANGLAATGNDALETPTTEFLESSTGSHQINVSTECAAREERGW